MNRCPLLIVPRLTNVNYSVLIMIAESVSSHLDLDFIEILGEMLKRALFIP